jgi:hypothetical protein
MTGSLLKRLVYEGTAEGHKRCALTHRTRLCSYRGLLLSTGFLPVISSSRTTPKLYTSPLIVCSPVIENSGAA